MVMHLLNIAPKLIFQYHLDMPPPPPLLDDFKLSFNAPVRNNKVEFQSKKIFIFFHYIEYNIKIIYRYTLHKYIKMV